MSELSTATLADLISKRRKCLAQLRDLGRRQEQAIAAGDMAALLRLIAAKQQLIVALQALERQLTPYHAQPPEARVWASPAMRAQCADDAEACRQLVQEVMALEQQGERQMTQRRDAAASQLRAAVHAGRVREAYLGQR
ncbi:MAG: flagellar export chaperone FlgN [Pirellulales bacterium]|nr:flagellar export chaperone FlgN [Pirellulales bacterium]